MLVRSIIGEDIQILNYLQTNIELKRKGKKETPVLWGVQIVAREFGVAAENADGWAVIFYQESTVVGKANDLQAVIQELSDSAHHGIGDLSEYEECKTIHDVVTKANEILEKIHGHRNAFGVEYYCDVHKVLEGPIFLTKGACIDYIEKHWNELNNPTPRKLYAKDCQELQKLYKILLAVDWDGTVSVGSDHACWNCRHSDLNGDPAWVGCSTCRHNMRSRFEAKSKEVSADGKN